MSNIIVLPEHVRGFIKTNYNIEFVTDNKTIAMLVSHLVGQVMHMNKQYRALETRLNDRIALDEDKLELITTSMNDAHNALEEALLQDGAEFDKARKEAIYYKDKYENLKAKVNAAYSEVAKAEPTETTAAE